MGTEYTAIFVHVTGAQGHLQINWSELIIAQVYPPNFQYHFHLHAVILNPCDTSVLPLN